LDYVIVAIFGGLIGSTELLSRYKDAPFRSALSSPALAYIFVNLIASIVALWLARLFQITFGIDVVAEPEKLRWVQVFAAGFGAMTLLRSSLFFLNINEHTVAIGPSSLLDALLRVLDREVDRRRAQHRADEVESIMDNVSFRKAKDQLPIISFALMQNLPRNEQDKVVSKVLELEKKAISDRAKSRALGLSLMDIVGQDVLRRAVGLIQEEVAVTPLGEAIENVEFVVDAGEKDE
jgi:hypothetical protein